MNHATSLVASTFSEHKKHLSTIFILLFLYSAERSERFCRRRRSHRDDTTSAPWTKNKQAVKKSVRRYEEEAVCWNSTHRGLKGKDSTFNSGSNINKASDYFKILPMTITTTTYNMHNIIGWSHSAAMFASRLQWTIWRNVRKRNMYTSTSQAAFIVTFPST